MDNINEALSIFKVGFEESNGSLFIRRTSETLVLPDTINKKPILHIGAHLFSSKDLKSVRLPSALEAIGDGAFQSNKLREVIVPRTVKSIGYYAFGDNPLGRIVIPPSVESIDEDTFNDTTGYLIIACVEGSYAHTYAKDGYDVELVTEEELDSIYSKLMFGSKEV